MAEATPGRSGAADAHGGRTGDGGRGGGTCRSGRRPRAQAARLSMGAYLRRRGLGQRVRIAAERRLGAAELRELNQIGVRCYRTISNEIQNHWLICIPPFPS